MVIGIDISQIVYEGTGVGRYVREIVAELLRQDKQNEYILFGASLRNRQIFGEYFNSVMQLSKRVKLITVPLPPTFLDLLWNKWHIIPIEWFIGKIDIFWSSDWVQPPLAQAYGITTIHDLSFLHFPESFNQIIIDVQNRRLTQAKKECKLFFCDSLTTLNDVANLLSLEKSKLRLVYPGFGDLK